MKTLFGLGLVALLVSGCGGEKTGTISGKVLYRGQPLPGGFGDFVSEQGKVVTTGIEANGGYLVSGVPVGLAKITVRDLSGAMDRMAKSAGRVKLPLAIDRRTTVA